MNGLFFTERAFQGGIAKSLRSLSLASGLLVLTACGFSPVYSPGGSAVGPVTIEQIDGRTGFFVRQELDRYAALERGNVAPKTLKVDLKQTFSSASFSVDGLAARTLLTLTASYTLSDASQNEPKKGFVTTTIGYESLDQAYGDVALQADAEERAAKQIADRLWADLRRQAQMAR